jgi:hypothetical protein
LDAEIEPVLEVGDDEVVAVETLDENEPDLEEVGDQPDRGADRLVGPGVGAGGQSGQGSQPRPGWPLDGAGAGTGVALRRIGRRINHWKPPRGRRAKTRSVGSQRARPLCLPRRY